MPFRFDKLTQKAQEAVQQAQELAGQNSHQRCTRCICSSRSLQSVRASCVPCWKSAAYNPTP